MGILSGESLFDQIAEGVSHAQRQNPKPENWAFRGFVVSEPDDLQGLEGLHAVGEVTAKNEWYSKNHVTGAYYKLNKAPEGVLYSPSEITRCIGHNYHLIAHLPEACRSQAWMDADGHILSLNDKLIEGYHHLRHMAFRAVVELYEAETAQADYQAKLTAFQEALEAMRNSECEYNNKIDLVMPKRITRETLRDLGARILGDGIPINPNHKPWEWPAHYSGGFYQNDSYIIGFCPQCREESVRLEVWHTNLNSNRAAVSPIDGFPWAGAKQGTKFGGKLRTVKTLRSLFVGSWQPNTVRVSVYEWPRGLTTPQQSLENATAHNEVEALPADAPEAWTPSEEPPVCKYCEFKF